MPKPHEINSPTLSLDTDLKAHRVQLEILKRMPMSRKFQLIGDAIETSRVFAMAGLRRRHPDAGPEELQRRFAGLWLGEELAQQVYGPLPE
jgi:hypothetical protein